MRVPYIVLIVVNDRWYSDQEEFSSLALARRHRRDVAEKWSDCDTAIGHGSRVLLFQESHKEQAALRALLEAA